MRGADIELTNRLNEKLTSFEDILPMPGIKDLHARECFVKQMVDSVRRINYVKAVLAKSHSASVTDPLSIAFDPIKAAAWYIQHDEIDEATWLVFLATHFGKNRDTKWKLVANVYGALGQRLPWTWSSIQGNVNMFRMWLEQNSVTIKIDAKFGNHHKYERINGIGGNSTGEAIATYINWVNGAGGHTQLFGDALESCNNDGRRAFADLFKSMGAVRRFGRTARFDYLTMIGKLEIAAIEPDSTYMVGSTGPYSGAKLLFGNTQPRNIYNLWLNGLEEHLGLYFGMQVLEDSLCNWQKNPNNYIHFIG